MPLMPINGHGHRDNLDRRDRREWIVAVTRARPLTLSGRFLRPGYVPAGLGSDPVMSASHSGAGRGEVTVRLIRGPAGGGRSARRVSPIVDLPTRLGVRPVVALTGQAGLAPERTTPGNRPCSELQFSWKILV